LGVTSLNDVRALQRGEKPLDLAELLDHVLASLYMRALFGRPSAGLSPIV
jgi:hypothetical protein